MKGSTSPLQLLSPLPDITTYNDNNKLQLPQKLSVQEYIPIYNTKFISLLRHTKNTDTTAINTIANTIIDLFKTHHTHNKKDSNKDKEKDSNKDRENDTNKDKDVNKDREKNSNKETKNKRTKTNN